MDNFGLRRGVVGLSPHACNLNFPFYVDKFSFYLCIYTSLFVSRFSCRSMKIGISCLSSMSNELFGCDNGRSFEFFICKLIFRVKSLQMSWFGPAFWKKSSGALKCSSESSSSKSKSSNVLLFDRSIWNSMFEASVVWPRDPRFGVVNPPFFPSSASPFGSGDPINVYSFGFGICKY